MQIITDKFGEIEYDQSAVITFPDGLLGFGAEHKYILLNADEDSPFKWLQSIENLSLAFLLIDPYTFKPDYKFRLDEGLKEELSIKTKDDYVVFVIVVVSPDPAESTANLLGPIILNIKNQRAKQLVLSSSRYTTRQRLLDDKR